MVANPTLGVTAEASAAGSGPQPQGTRCCVIKVINPNVTLPMTGSDHRGWIVEHLRAGLTMSVECSSSIGGPAPSLLIALSAALPLAPVLREVGLRSVP
jgi:hypothetical protein